MDKNFPHSFVELLPIAWITMVYF